MSHHLAEWAVDTLWALVLGAGVGYWAWQGCRLAARGVRWLRRRFA